MACNCNKAAPVRKPYADRECAEDAWVRYATQDTARSPCPCKGVVGRSHAGHEESTARSRDMTDILSRLAELESISRNHDDVLMHAQVRLNHMHQRLQAVERHGPKVLRFGEERLGTTELKPGAITGNAFDAPEHYNAKELPKHAKELRSEVIVEVNSDGSLSVSENTPLSAGDTHTFTGEARLRYSDHDLVLRPRTRRQS